MASDCMNGVLRGLRRSLLAQNGGGCSDGQLLDGFVTRRDESAFAALVRRHGPMVLGVCRRIVGHCQDAEDAFQATFLVLLRKAASIRPRDLVGPWLYGVACRTALDARARALRRRAREHSMNADTPTAVSASPPEREALRLLDEELQRLPEKYRSAVVLCELEGRPRSEAARHLRIPEGTLSSRLATARRLLARRLGRRGVEVGVAALGASLAGTAAAVPPPLLAATTHAIAQFAAGKAGALSTQVTALTEGVLKTMFLSKLKLVTAVALLVAVFGFGLYLRIERPAEARQGHAPGAESAQTNPPPEKKPPTDEQCLQGRWKIVKALMNGKDAAGEEGDNIRKTILIFKDGQLISKRPNGDFKAPYKLDPSKNPKHLDIGSEEGSDNDGQKPFQGIYKFEGEMVHICGAREKPRPKEFNAAAGSPYFLIVLKREVPPKDAKPAEPLSCYSKAGPIGEIFRTFKDDPRLQRVGVIGLGTGTLAAYSQPVQEWTFYEIDERVKQIAEDPKQFTFLRDAKGTVRIVLGDARLLLQKSKDTYGLLVIDGFTSDALPVHLLTREAISLYWERLPANGILVFHISNRQLDLESVLANVAAELKCVAYSRRHTPSAEEKKLGVTESQWLVMARQNETLAPLLKSGSWQPARTRPGAQMWTDDVSNIVEALRKKGDE